MLRCSDGSYRTIKNRIKKELQIGAECKDVEAFVRSMGINTFNLKAKEVCLER